MIWYCFAFSALIGTSTPNDNDLPSVLVIPAQENAQLQEMAENVERNFDLEYKTDLERIKNDVLKDYPKDETPKREKKRPCWQSFKKCILSIWYKFDPLAENLENF